MPIITISRQTGSFGDEIAETLSKKLGFELLDRKQVLSKFISKIATPFEMRTLSESARFFLSQSAQGVTFLQYMKDSLIDYGCKESIIVVGCGAQTIFAENKQAIRIRIVAPEAVRLERIKKLYNMKDSEAEEILSISDRKHNKFVSVLFGTDVSDPSLYDLTLNTALLSVYECVTLILTLLKERQLSYSFEKQSDAANAVSNTEEIPVLKNPSEIEFAKILDMYHIDWKYEPKTFPIEWDAEGNITLAFSPDFYLTKFNTYIELTVMNQKYINKKMKKLRRLKELYPGINVKIVNKKNFYSLLERFNPKGVDE